MKTPFKWNSAASKLYNDPIGDGEPPSGVIALRFTKVESAALMRRESCGPPLQSDWFTMLSKDRVEPPSLDPQEFTLSDPEIVSRLVAEASSFQSIGEIPNTELQCQRIAEGTKLAFWAGNAGLYILAEDIVILNCRGVIDPSTLREKSEAWWGYWREYWRRKDSTTPMPKDYACEATIPLEE